MGSETASGSIGIIYPPPELRNIVDKTASFVARNGPEFEFRIQQNEQNNPKFNFLKPGDPYNAYYRHKVNEFKEQQTKPGSEQNGAQPSKAVGEQDGNKDKAAPTVPSKPKTQQELLAEIIPKEPPPEFEFSVDPPSISALDLEIVKLTAQFAAIHGRSFITNLMNRESRNYQFDFLRPQHGLFNYFTQLIEQYNKILFPPKTLTLELRRDSTEQRHVLQKVRYRYEWTKIQEAERRREEEEAEKERLQYAQIDWHDFVIVETVDYQPNEQGLFPPPTTPEQVGSRVLLQQRMEETGAQEEVEMEVESDEEEEKPQDEATRESLMPPPLPPSLDNVLIRKDYNPKAAKTQAPAGKETWVISPITGERIPAEKLQEHMRYSLLDPNWVEERDRQIQEKMTQEEVYASGAAIESSLKQLAERRTDIFGSGDEETAIGKKIGEEDRRKPDKVIWDGHTTSAEAAVNKAKASITIEEQIQHIHKMKGLVGDDDKDKIGPSLPPSSTASSSQQSSSISQPPKRKHETPQTHAPPSHPPLVTSVSSNPPLIPQPPHMAMAGLMPPPAGGPFMMHHGLGMYGMPVHLSMLSQMPPNSVAAGLAQQAAQQMEEEPSSKLQRTDVIPEEEYIKMNPDPISFSVQVPNMSDKPEWNMKGQILSVTMTLSETVAALKSKIQQETGLPPGKQKLQYDANFLKDSNTLASYNISPSSCILLALKERGGRKK